MTNNQYVRWNWLMYNWHRSWMDGWICNYGHDLSITYLSFISLSQRFTMSRVVKHHKKKFPWTLYDSMYVWCVCSSVSHCSVQSGENFLYLFAYYWRDYVWKHRIKFELHLHPYFFYFFHDPYSDLTKSDLSCWLRSCYLMKHKATVMKKSISFFKPGRTWACLVWPAFLCNGIHCHRIILCK